MKLLESLAVLKKDEWISLRKFILMHTRENSDLYNLFKAFQSSKNKLDNGKVLVKIKEKYFSVLKDKAFLNLQSALYQHVENWIVYFDIKNDHFEHELQLIKSLNNRGLFDQATYIYDRLLKNIRNSDTLDFHQSSRMSKLHHAMYYSDNHIKRNRPALLSDTVSAHIQANQLQLLFYQLELSSWGKIMNLNHKKELDSIGHMLVNNTDNQFDGITSELRKVVLDLDGHAFVKCILFLQHNTIDTNSEFAKIFILYLFSKANLIHQHGNIDDKEILLWIGYYAFDSGAAASNNELPEIRFYNSIAYFAHFGGRQAAQKFVDQWKHKIISKYPKSTVRIAQALVEYYCDNFQGVIDEIQHISSLEFSSKIIMSAILLISYYECRSSYGEVLLNFIDNYKRFLFRHKKEHKRIVLANRNLLEIIELLHVKRMKPHEIDLEKYKFIMHRLWVLRKLKA